MKICKVIPITTATTTVIGTGTVPIHTVNFPKATAGTVTVTDTDGNTLFVFPAGSIGCQIIEGSFTGNGIKFVTASADAVLVSIYD